MVDYLPRSAWNARSPRGRTALVASRVDGMAVHWPGTPSSTPMSKAAVPRYLRAIQDYHMDSRGWSDIAYQVAVDQWGRAWILRGLTTQSAANGNTDVNQRYGAILLLLVKGEQPSAAMLSTARGVIADFQQHYPNGRLVVGHGQVRPDGTDCPGAATRAAIAAGRLTPGAPEEDDMPYRDWPQADKDALTQDIRLEVFRAEVGGVPFHELLSKIADRSLRGMQAAQAGEAEDVWRAEISGEAAHIRLALIGDRTLTAKNVAAQNNALLQQVLIEQGVAEEKIDAILAAVEEERPTELSVAELAEQLQIVAKSEEPSA